MRMIRTTLAVAAAGLGLSCAVIASSEAEARSRGYDRDYAGYVVAESRWGHGTVSGPVRNGRRGGWQVRLPGGTWIDCVRDNCEETLRMEALDLFEVMEQKDGGPFYFDWKLRY